MSRLRYDEWIKVRKILPRDPRVIQLGRRLGISRREAFAAVVEFWVWVDDFAELAIPREDNGDGPIDGVLEMHAADADEFLSLPKFCESMPKEWLRVEGGLVVLPKYTEHNGQNSKLRANEAKRKAELREESGQTSGANRTDVRKTPDKRRKRSGRKTGQMSGDRWHQEQEQEREQEQQPETLPSGAKNEHESKREKGSDNANKSGEAAPASPERLSSVSRPDRRRDLVGQVRAVLESYAALLPEGGITPAMIAAGEPLRAFAMAEERIREGSTEEELVEAIRGVAGSEWHRSNGHTSIEMILRSRENVSKYREMLRRQRSESSRRESPGSGKSAKVDPFEEAMNDPTLDRLFRPGSEEGGER